MFTWPAGDRRGQAAEEYPESNFPTRRYQGQNYDANMRAAQTVREVAVAQHMKPGQIARGATGEVARKRNRRRLVSDPVRLMAGGGVLSALSVEPLMAVGLVVLVIVLEPDQLEIHFRGGDTGSAARAAAW